MKNSIIRVLPEAIANKIAAGEVVERPASVVKELVENALDANSIHITVILRQAGKLLIEVIDDGEGMSEEDSAIAFKRHATSKIMDIKDLNHIATMGFRGEALPSIASVSRVEVTTRKKEDSLASVLKIEGGILEKRDKAAAPVGTSIKVKNLFFNIPARKNFLKTDATELSHIINMLKRFFLANPDISFQIYSDDEKVYDLPRGTLKDRIKKVLGDSFFSGLLSVSEGLGNIKLTGYVLKPDLARHSRGHQFLFINNRLIVSKYIHHAIVSAFGHKIEKKQFPGYCFYLSIDPEMIDVNVHPTKMEVRFTDERMIYKLFLTSVQRALNVDEVVPEMPDFKMKQVSPEKTKRAIIEEDSNVITIEDLSFRPRQTFGKGVKKMQPTFPNQSRLTFTYKAKDAILDKRLNSQKQNEQSKEEYQTLWQIHNRYILSQIKSGFAIIDQHVAHERILYERILNALENKSKYYSQQLLFPQTVNLSPEDFALFTDLHDMINQIGYSVKPFGGTTIVIEAIPGDIKIGNELHSLLEIIDYHRENVTKKRNPMEQMAAAFSCRNAIKSGEKLSLTEMQALVDQLFSTSTPYFCPHGRPVIITISLQELDKKFKRT